MENVAYLHLFWAQNQQKKLDIQNLKCVEKNYAAGKHFSQQHSNGIIQFWKEKGS